MKKIKAKNNLKIMKNGREKNIMMGNIQARIKMKKAKTFEIFIIIVSVIKVYF